MKSREIVAAVIGAGYAARLHSEAYKRVYGAAVNLKWIIDIDVNRANSLKETYGYTYADACFQTALTDPEVDVIDICTPPMCHKNMIIDALKAGKHVICEKPLLGYFGEIGDESPVGIKVPKAKMYRRVLEDLEDLENVVKSSGRKLCYADNYIYSAAVQRIAEIVTKKKSKLLFLKGEESLKGSAALAAGEWSNIGGGSLIRAGSHLIVSVLMLKQAEAKARGEKIAIQSVTADMGMATKCLNEHDHRYIDAYPHDVEDYASVIITFTDGTKAQVTASDLLLGGTRGFVEVYANDGVLKGRISPVDVVESYFRDEENLEEVELSEMLPHKTGWNKPFVADETLRGFSGELQDFVEAILDDREPLAGFELACETMKVIYGAYLAAEEGKKFVF